MLPSKQLAKEFSERSRAYQFASEDTHNHRRVGNIRAGECEILQQHVVRLDCHSEAPKSQQPNCSNVPKIDTEVEFRAAISKRRLLWWKKLMKNW